MAICRGTSGLRLAHGERGGVERSQRRSHGATSHVHVRWGVAVCQGGCRTSPAPAPCLLTLPAVGYHCLTL